ATELAIATDVGARIVGVNNRNLRTLQVDLRASDDLIAAMPRDVAAISESGLTDSADLLRLREAGYRAFLIGERFVTREDPGRELRELLANAEGANTARDAETASHQPSRTELKIAQAPNES